MPDRDARLLSLRPTLALETLPPGPIEAFQNQTLRPILKLQNPVILALVACYLQKYCPRFGSYDRARKLAYVRDLLRRDSRPKHMLVGLTAGHFTTDEFAFFVEHEAEVRRRLVDLCLQRVEDQLDVLPLDPPAA